MCSSLPPNLLAFFRSLVARRRPRMLIRDDQTHPEALAAIGSQAVQLLCSEDFSALAGRFGYSLAYDREPALAIREDLASSLAEIGASRLGRPPGATPSVSYFNPNDAGLFALIEQRVPADNGEHVLLELIVTARGAEKHVLLEQVSALA